MDKQVYSKLSEQRERLDKLRSDWFSFASKCRDQIKAITKERPIRIVDLQEIALWDLWNSISVLSSPTEKLKALRAIAYKQYGNISKKRLRRKRKKFDKIKRHIVRIRGSECFVCGAPAQVRHHVVQLQNGGNNSQLNVIPLCNSCHGSIHPWMDIRTLP